MYANIPAELRALPQWVVWKYVDRGGDKPTKMPYNAFTGAPASSTDPATWCPFDTAVQAAASNACNGIGFVLSLSDPYCFIDLDTYDPTLSDADKARHAKIYEAFPGYAELSPSGKGLHLIVKGKTIDGKKRRGVEIYSSGRFMTMTGNAYRAAPIEDAQELVSRLWEECGGEEVSSHANATLDVTSTKTDAQVIDQGLRAVNGERFKNLLNGEWKLDYPSQSEADFAFVDMLAFYTQDRAQIKRIFRASPLGQREKAQRDSYFDAPRYGMLNKAFDNQPPQVDVDAMAAMLNRKLAEIRATPVPMPPGFAPEQVPTLPVAGDPGPSPEPHAEQAAPAPAVYQQHTPSQTLYTAPPGLVGEIAHYIYASAPRPVPEIALCAAIGLLAGITGRAYNVSGTGLNQYILLLATTGSGKEGMANGIGHLMTAVCRTVPGASDFIGPGEIRSDAALLKYLAKRSASFLTLTGEFSSYLSQMANVNAPAHLKGIKRALLDLYSKSGRGQVLRQTIYSDSDKSTKEVLSPAFSMLGEGAPDEFYEALDERLIADGLLTRFTIFEYKGPQPVLNEQRNQQPPPELVERVAQLAAQCLQINNANTAVDVQLSPEALSLMQGFERFCREQINGRDATEVTRHIWNRAHLRAMKMAALVAVGQNPFQPTIDYAAALWATDLSYANTKALLGKFERGEVGAVAGDDKHVQEVTRVIRDFILRDAAYIGKYCDGVDEAVRYQNARVVPYGYINKRLSAVSAFRTDRRGAAFALRVAITTMIDSGKLVELSKQDAFNKFTSAQRCYAIAKPAAFLPES